MSKKCAITQSVCNTYEIHYRDLKSFIGYGKKNQLKKYIQFENKILKCKNLKKQNLNLDSICEKKLDCIDLYNKQ